MGNVLGRLFTVTTFGESHGPGLGCVIDGCPPRVALTVAMVQAALERRAPGRNRLTSPRREPDAVEILSGVDDGQTLGTPIAMLVRNQDARGRDYDDIARAYRPSHADYTTVAKYGIRAVAGGGRASARETVGRVAAGAVAEQVLAPLGITIVAWVRQVADVAIDLDGAVINRADVDAHDVRCPDAVAAAAMTARIEAARKDGDSVGGVIEAVVRGMPVGLGAPVFDRLHADLGKALLSLPAVKGFEVGSGFAGTAMTGSTHNDLFYRDDQGRVRTHTNHSGGVQGGISNGEDLRLRVAFKPTATIMRPQATIDVDGKPTMLAPRGRHDPCVLPRAVPMVEAMIALVLVDHWMRHRAHVALSDLSR